MPLDYQQVSAAHFPEPDRFELWREHVMKDVVGVRPEMPPAGIGTLRFDAKIWSGANFARYELDCCALKIHRNGPEINHRPWDSFLVYREHREGVEITVGDQVFTPRPGEYVVWDAEAPFWTQTKTDFSWDGWMLPKSLLAPHLPALGRPLGLHLPDSATVGLLGSYMDALARDMSPLEGPHADLVADHLGRLVAIACGAAAGGQKLAVRAAKLIQAKRYIDLHLGDPELGPATTAAALGISVRQLHLLFEDDDVSFAALVQRRRLLECRRILQSPASLSRSVTDIAFAWGFGSLSTFYRAFHAEFGMKPGDVRGGRG